MINCATLLLFALKEKTHVSSTYSQCVFSAIFLSCVFFFFFFLYSIFQRSLSCDHGQLILLRTLKGKSDGNRKYLVRLLIPGIDKCNIANQVFRSDRQHIPPRAVFSQAGFLVDLPSDASGGGSRGNSSFQKTPISCCVCPPWIGEMGQEMYPRRLGLSCVLFIPVPRQSY